MPETSGKTSGSSRTPTGGSGNASLASTTTATTTSSSSSGSIGAPREKLHLKPQVVRIEVLGDEKVGKTSLICSLVSRHYSEKVPSVLLNVQIPAEESDENVVISITDTSSRVSDLMRVANATKRSDAILLVYDLTRPETFQRLRRWLDFIARHRDIPVVLVANKKDINVVTPEGSYAHQVRTFVQSYPFVVAAVESSAKNFAEVANAFYLAQKAVLYPTEPLYNVKKKHLEPKCVKAIKRTFRLYNRDRSGVLSRDELNEYQHDCFGMRLLATEMDTMIEFLAAAIPTGVAPNGSGLFFEGFQYLWQLFIDRHRPESCWQVLRSLGYTNELHLEIPLERIALPLIDDDQSAQLTAAAIEFLTLTFRQFDANKDGLLTSDEVTAVFSICDDEQPPWETCAALTAPLQIKHSVVDNRVALPLASWLACWSFVAQENPTKLLETLFYLGYNDKLAPALELTKGRELTREGNVIDRNVVTCYIYGLLHADKRAFVNALVERRASQLTASDANANDNDIDNSDASDAAMLRSISAVVDKDATKYLLVTQAITETEIAKKADVLCILFNPHSPASLAAAEDAWTKLMPASIPRVAIAYQTAKSSSSSNSNNDDDASSATATATANANTTSIVTERVRATDAMLKPFEVSFVCDSDSNVLDAAALLVRTALRPPKNARNKTGSAFGLTKTRVGVVFGVVLAGVASVAGVAYAKPEYFDDVLRSVRDAISAWRSSESHATTAVAQR